MAYGNCVFFTTRANMASPLILDLTRHRLSSSRLRLQDYAIWSGNPNSTFGVIRYQTDGHTQLSVNRVNLDKRIFLDRSGKPHVDEFFKMNKDTIFDAIVGELYGFRMAAEMPIAFPPRPNTVLLRKP